MQEWLNVAGLGLDFVGILMLANEWRIMLNAEQREAELAAHEQRMKPHPMMPKPNIPQQPVFEYMRDQQKFLEMSNRGRQTRQIRRKWFIGALIIVATGFLLQILGSIPFERLAG